MTEIIAALQNEIAAAQKKRGDLYRFHELVKLDIRDSHVYTQLGGYIQGLNQALYLLTREPTRELGQAS
jgi:hypothetical protein